MILCDVKRDLGPLWGACSKYRVFSAIISYFLIGMIYYAMMRTILAMTFGRRLSQLLSKRGISNYRLAKDLGINESSIRAWRKNVNQPRSDTIKRLASYLNISPAWLLFGDEEHAPTLHDDVMRIAVKIEEYAAKNPGELDRIEGLIEVITGESFRRDSSVQKGKKKKRRQSAA